MDTVNFRDLTSRFLVEPFRVDTDLFKRSTSSQIAQVAGTKTHSDEATLKISTQAGPVEVNITQ